MRDMEKNPYTKDEQRVAKFFFERGAGGGDDPIGALLAFYQFLVAEHKKLLEELATARRSAR